MKTTNSPRWGRGAAAAALTVVLAASSQAGAFGVADSAAPPGQQPLRAPAKGKVTIKRDSYGVPHVYANTTYDLFRGYGYVVAEDRLFQMEMSKRSTQGTVAEVLGPEYLAYDKDTRNGFDPASIHAQIAKLSAEDRAILDGYAAGMNEYIAKIPGKPGVLMPKQFLDYGFQPSTWTGYDVAMVWVGTMANRYSDGSSEIPNYQMLQSLIAAKGDKQGRALFDQLVWQEDPRAVTTEPASDKGQTRPIPRRPGSAAGSGAGAGSRAMQELKPLAPGVRDVGVEQMKRHGGGSWPTVNPESSNLWAVGKTKAAGANSILVNGPQFQWFNPSYVFGIGLHGAGFDISGSTPFAYPSVIFGTNGDIAWGSTAGPLNLVDIYQETLDPANAKRYKFNGAYRDMTSRTVTIKVKGAEDVQHEVLSTVHGPVTSVDPANGTAYSKKRSWSGHEVQSLIAWVHMTKSRGWSEWRSHASKFATTINMYYADAKGNIGYISPGFMPARPANQDMRIPAKGDGSMEWTGVQPFSNNPQVLNPRQGYIQNWNNQSGPGQNNDYGNWGAVDRANEIDSAMRTAKRINPKQMWDLNEKFSFADLHIRYLKPSLRAAAAKLPKGDPRRKDIELILAWDGQTRDRDENGTYDGPEPAIMRAWMPLLFQKVLADDLPDNVFKAYTTGIYPTTPVETRGSIRPANAMKLVYNAILGSQAGVPQSVDFFNGARPEDVVASTYLEAVAGLRSAKGSNTAAWTAPTAHMAYSYKNFVGVPQAGAGEQLAGPEYANRGTANHMAVLGTKGQNRLCIVSPPGQSGFVAPDGTKSPHYDDQLTLYKRFDCRDEFLTDSQSKLKAVNTTVLN